MTLQIVEVVIGLSFVYLLFSIISSAFNELVAGLLGLRQGTLRRGIARLLSDNRSLGEQLAAVIYNSPVVRGLCHGTGWRKDPSYIDKNIFASVLLDSLIGKGVLDTSGQRKRLPLSDAKTGASPWNSVADALSTLATGSTLDHLRDAAARWFDAAMDRVSGAYKRQTQTVLLGLAIAVVLGFNVDTIAIVRTLWTDPHVRATVAERAATYAAPDLKAPADPVAQIKAANERYSQSIRDLNVLEIPLGWPAGFWSKRLHETNLAKVFGLILSTIAISLGAPFWFDVLCKVSNLRAAGKVPEGSGTNKAKDLPAAKA